MINGVHYKIGELQNESENAFVARLYEHTEEKKYEPHSSIENKEKVDSWIDCLRFLKKYFKEIESSEIQDIDILFEYKIFDGTWIDVVIICKSKYIILEFKSGEDCREETLLQHRIQVDGYYNKITRCNKNIWKEMQTNISFVVKKYLIYTNPKMLGKVADLEYIKVTDEFRGVLADLQSPESSEKVEMLLNFDEELDVTTIGVIRDILKKKLLSEMYVEDDNVTACTTIIEKLRLNNKGQDLNIIFVKGAPGTGKTGTGFCLLEKYLKENAKYVTGNGNLSNIFQQMICKEGIRGVEAAAVGSLHNIYNLRKFCKKYKDKDNNVKAPIIASDILIIDEAQRMWNPLRMAIDKKENYTKEYINYIIEREISEAYIVLHSLVNSSLLTKKSKTVVFLMGTGQEIYLGEEDGEKCIVKAISQLCSIIDSTNKNISVNVFVPDEELALQFSNDKCNIKVVNELKLEENKRNQYSQDALQFVEALLEGNKDEAKIKARNLRDSYLIYNDFEKLNVTLNPIKNAFSCGIAMNSFDGNYNPKIESSIYCVEGKNIINISNKDLYDYYISKDSNSMNTYVSQFNCQGLEMDYPVVIWGDILTVKNNKWIIRDKDIYAISNYCKRINEIIASNPTLSAKLQQLNEADIRDRFIKNCYRVLLTRARISTLIYVKDKETFDYLNDILC